MLKESHLIVRELQNVFMSYNNNNESFLPLLKVFFKKKNYTIESFSK